MKTMMPGFRVTAGELWDHLNGMVWQFGGEETCISAGEDAEEILEATAELLGKKYLNHKQRVRWRKKRIGGK